MQKNVPPQKQQKKLRGQEYYPQPYQREHLKERHRKDARCKTQPVTQQELSQIPESEQLTESSASQVEQMVGALKEQAKTGRLPLPVTPADIPVQEQAKPGRVGAIQEQSKPRRVPLPVTAPDTATCTVTSTVFSAVSNEQVNQEKAALPTSTLTVTSTELKPSTAPDRLTVSTIKSTSLSATPTSIDQTSPGKKPEAHPQTIIISPVTASVTLATVSSGEDVSVSAVQVQSTVTAASAGVVKLETRTATASATTITSTGNKDTPDRVTSTSKPATVSSVAKSTSQQKKLSVSVAAASTPGKKSLQVPQSPVAVSDEEFDKLVEINYRELTGKAKSGQSGDVPSKPQAKAEAGTSQQGQGLDRAKVTDGQQITACEMASTVPEVTPISTNTVLASQTRSQPYKQVNILTQRTFQKEKEPTGMSTDKSTEESEEAEDEHSKMSVSQKMSLFRKLDAQQKKVPIPNKPRRYHDRRKWLERSQTQPVTEEELKEASEISKKQKKEQQSGGVIEETPSNIEAETGEEEKKAVSGDNTDSSDQVTSSDKSRTTSSEMSSELSSELSSEQSSEQVTTEDSAPREEETEQDELCK